MNRLKHRWHGLWVIWHEKKAEQHSRKVTEHFAKYIDMDFVEEKC